MATQACVEVATAREVIKAGESYDCLEFSGVQEIKRQMYGIWSGVMLALSGLN